jgi:phospholipid/cholesterol/gamma-HCH transport system substrate-binding protein
VIQAVNALWKVKWAVAFAAIVVLGLLAGHATLGATAYRLRIPMDNAAGLYPGSDVEIAGSKAGSVETVGLQSGKAVVTITVDPEHAPVRKDASVALRPKSLLGEKYLDLDPGSKGESLASGATLPANAVSEPVELEDVINTFDQPTREKLTVLIDELGTGLAGRGPETNQGFQAGRNDMDDLAAVATTLQQKDADLEQVIQSLSAVLEELAQSDRRQQIGELIANTEALMNNLANQDAQLKRALAETNAALGRSAVALDGTGQNLGDIFNQAPTAVQQTGVLTNGLGQGLDALMPHMNQLIVGIREGPIVFGGYDAAGYATRISVDVGPGSVGAPGALGSQPGLSGNPLNNGSTPQQDAQGVFGFLLGGPTP